MHTYHIHILNPNEYFTAFIGFFRYICYKFDKYECSDMYSTLSFSLELHVNVIELYVSVTWMLVVTSRAGTIFQQLQSNNWPLVNSQAVNE